jgi:hypothetical protein
MEQTTDQLIERLKTAQAPAEIAKITRAILRSCGVFNVQSVGYELARLSVTQAPE